MFKSAIKRWSLRMAAVLATPLMAFAGVTVSSPAPGATSASPVHFVASASSAQPIVAMTIYVDNVSMFTTHADHLDMSLDLAAGPHYVVVQAWDASNLVMKAPENILVGTSSQAPASSGEVAHPGIQAMPGWESCTVCAGVNGLGPVATYSMGENVASPSLSGQAAQFSISGGTPYADAIWWKQLGADNNKSNFQYDLDFYLTQPQLAEALEFDVNQSTGNMKFIYGTQCNIKGDGQWDVWDTAGNTWRPTGIACAMPAALQWHHLTWQFYRDASTVHFVSVTLDGVTHYVNRAYNAKPVNAAELNAAFQLDGDYAMHPVSAWLDNVTLTSW